MPPKSKVEKSEHFNEIVDLLLNGWSSRKVSAYLENEYDEKINYVSIYNYQKKHLDIESDVAVEVEKKKEKAKEVNRDELQRKKAEAIKREVARKDKAQQNYDKAVQRGVTAQSVIELAISYGGDIIEDVMNDPAIEKLDKAKLIKDYIKLQIDFNKNNDTIVEVNNDIDLSKAFDDDEIRAILKGEDDTNK